MDRYDHRRDELWAACVEAEKTIDRIRKDTQAKKEKAISNYAEHLKLIPTPIAKKACHELARRGFTVPRHGVQGPYSPIKMIGWADYRHNDSWMDQGVAFQIDPDCFESDEPVIYYQDDDSWPGSGDICEKKLELVRLYSSGIGNVRAEDRIVKDWYGQTAQRRTLVFELAPAKVKTSISLSGKDVSTAETGPYVFVLPRAGEFYCTIGEIVGENAYTLHRDDFCMK